MPDPITPQADEQETPAFVPALSPAAESPPSSPEAPADTLALLSELAERERALATRERQFHARQHALALGLDAAILAHFDYSSDEALQHSLQVATLALRSAAGILPAAAPLAAKPAAPAFATYLERARLFRDDPAAYRQMMEKPQ